MPLHDRATRRREPVSSSVASSSLEASGTDPWLGHRLRPSVLAGLYGVTDVAVMSLLCHLPASGVSRAQLSLPAVFLPHLFTCSQKIRLFIIIIFIILFLFFLIFLNYSFVNKPKLN